jgi:hypothetical protein
MRPPQDTAAALAAVIAAVAAGADPLDALEQTSVAYETDYLELEERFNEHQYLTA